MGIHWVLVSIMPCHMLYLMDEYLYFCVLLNFVGILYLILIFAQCLTYMSICEYMCLNMCLNLHVGIVLMWDHIYSWVYSCVRCDMFCVILHFIYVFNAAIIIQLIFMCVHSTSCVSVYGTVSTF